ncbi:hypothetical protein FGB62_265g03 [Gracilaria domingensis]|nr:hypothetical protein FGB62_265g03 [Gracilaria domingensis]
MPLRRQPPWGSCRYGRCYVAMLEIGAECGEDVLGWKALVEFVIIRTGFVGVAFAAWIIPVMSRCVSLL